MNIIVKSKRLAKEFISDIPWAAISVSTHGDWPILNKCQQTALLQLAFADADTQSEATEAPLFTEHDAENILSFIQNEKHKIEILLVHCEAGISRSPAIAAALSLIIDGDDKYFFKPPYRPNMMVYRTILNKAIEKGLLSPV